MSPRLQGSFPSSGAPACEVPDAYVTLSLRERQLFHLLAEGLLNHQIASHLYLSVRTIESHRATLMRKLGLKTNIDLVLYALRRGFLTIDDASGAPRLDV